MGEIITFDLTVPSVGGIDHMPFSAPDWADLGSFSHGVNMASVRYNQWADRVTARYVQNAEKVIAQVREFEQRVNHILKSNFVLMAAATQFIEYRANELAEVKAQELAREALAKATQSENIAKAIEYNSSLLWAENEDLRKALGEANEKLARIERANKFESVQVALGRDKKPKRVKTRGLEDYE